MSDSTGSTEAGVTLGLVLRTLGRLEHGVERIEDRLEKRDEELGAQIQALREQRDRDRKFAVTSFIAAMSVALGASGLGVTLLIFIIQHWK